MPVSEFCRLAVEKKGVLLLSGDVYEADGPYFRMGYGRKAMGRSGETRRTHGDQLIVVRCTFMFLF